MTCNFLTHVFCVCASTKLFLCIQFLGTHCIYAHAQTTPRTLATDRRRHRQTRAYSRSRTHTPKPLPPPAGAKQQLAHTQVIRAPIYTTCTTPPCNGHPLSHSPGVQLFISVRPPMRHRRFTKPFCFRST